MYEYIAGELEEVNPSYVIISTGGIGYFVHITLSTFSEIQSLKNAKLFIHQVVREDAHLFFGFSTKSEREIFRHLISVSGIGPNTARMVLSSLSPSEVQQAIQQANIDVLKSIKGIGAKSAQRMVIDLKDKIGKGDEVSEIILTSDNTIRDEALSALVMLGFTKSSVAKIIDQILKDRANHSVTVEQLVKMALKKL